MKLFCRCNCTWEIDYAPAYLSAFQYVLVTEIPDMCLKCDTYYWYNPQYENMLFDLREMNRC